MTYAVPDTSGLSRPQHRRPSTVDIAGVAWPVYKVEALVLAMAVFLGALALTTSLQVAVLTSAATAVLAWWSLLLLERRSRD